MPGNRLASSICRINRSLSLLRHRLPQSEAQKAHINRATALNKAAILEEGISGAGEEDMGVIAPHHPPTMRKAFRIDDSMLLARREALT